MDIFFFVIFLIIFLYIPGFLIIKKIKLLTDDTFINTGLILITGLIFLTISSLFIRIFGLPWKVLWIFGIISFLFLLKNSKEIVRLSPTKKNITSYLLILAAILAGVIAQSAFLINGGRLERGVILFPSFHDSMWNISVINELLINMPPQHPGFAGITLKNYHYFYHLFLATTHSLSGINIITLYYKLAPIFISFLFGMSLYTIASQYTKSFFWRSVSILFGYFSGNFAFFVPLFFPTRSWQSNIFLSEQALEQIVNPQTLLGITLFLFIIYALYKYIRSNNLSWGLLMALMVGVSYGFKSFAGALSLLVVLSTIVISLLSLRKKGILFTLFITCGTWIGTFLYLTSPKEAGLLWAPGWLLTNLVKDQNRFPLLDLVKSESYYSAIQNWKGLLKIRSIEFSIYFFGNLGTRFFGLLFLLIKAKDNILSRILFLGVFFAFSIPLFFNLSTSSYDIIQFTPYALVLLSLATVIAVSRTSHSMAIIVLLFLLSFPTTIKTLNEVAHEQYVGLPQEEVRALEYLKQESSPGSIILTPLREVPSLNFIKDHESQDYIGGSKRVFISESPAPMYISALSQRKLYFGEIKLAEFTGNNPTQRINAVNDFFNGKKEKDFIKRNNIDFIYIPKKNTSGLPLDYIESLHFKKILENPYSIIYKLVD